MTATDLEMILTTTMIVRLDMTPIMAILLVIVVGLAMFIMMICLRRVFRLIVGLIFVVASAHCCEKC